MYNEMKKIDQICLDTKSKENTYDYVVELVNNLDLYGSDLVLSGKYYWPEIDDQLCDELKKYMLTLLSTKPLIIHGNPSHEFGETRQEKYYGTIYEVVWDNEIWNNSSKSQRIINKIMVPGSNKNPYIPENLSMIENKTEKEIIKMSSCVIGELWYKLDTVHNQPKISMSLICCSVIQW